MKNLILMLLLIGLLSNYASAESDSLLERVESMTDEEKREIAEEIEVEKRETVVRELKEYYKKQYRKEQTVEQIKKEAREEVDAENVRLSDIFQIDETTLYYLFSTIAQTLAGAFGILGVFAMYKLQSIENTCKGIGDTIIQSHCRTKHLPEVYMSYSNRDWNAFRESIKKYMAEHNDLHKKPEFRVCYELDEKTISRYSGMLLRSISNRTKIKKQIISALKLTIITISYSVLVLPFSTAVAHYQSLTIVLTATVIMLSIKCLLDYSSLVLNALGLKDGVKKKG